MYCIKCHWICPMIKHSSVSSHIWSWFTHSCLLGTAGAAGQEFVRPGARLIQTFPVCAAASPSRPDLYPLTCDITETVNLQIHIQTYLSAHSLHYRHVSVTEKHGEMNEDTCRTCPEVSRGVWHNVSYSRLDLIVLFYFPFFVIFYICTVTVM